MDEYVKSRMCSFLGWLIIDLNLNLNLLAIFWPKKKKKKKDACLSNLTKCNHKTLEMNA